MSVEPEPSANSSESADLATTPEGPEGAEVFEGSPSEVVVLSPEEMDCYECRSCGYSYEPVKGDSRAKVPQGTAFEDLPLNWRCPVCSAPKKRFANIGPINAPSGFKENLNYGLGVNRLTPSQKNILIFGALAVGFMFFISLYGLR
ncbi:rubredoxin [Leptolyngbya sp. CCNP1308]|uniref:rubredoxin n=1 Tax=Leptolyngbya sp. CCNP1308 TaxID=3110255 RepID=UPI002B21FDA6|nr:rubredoxin [Leptolyngbya sp. CCNP1308]MEA5447180.1 rubredoxin [Leptolyngbya sp. CCNP1308]